MKVLYISNRLNASDGSSVHGRAFAASVKLLGHKIITYPKIKPISFLDKTISRPNKTIGFYFKKLNFKTFKYYLKKSNSFVNDVICYLEGISRNRQHFTDIEKLYLSFNPDIIVFRHTLYDNAPLLIKNKYKLPCIIEVNSIKSIESQLYKNKKIGFLPRRAELNSLQQSDYAFCVSDPIKDWIDTATNSNKTTVIPNGVDTDMFNVNNYNIDNIKKELGLNGKIIIGYIGSYKKWHGIEISINTIKMLVESNPDFHLLLVGNGDEYINIQKLIEQNSLTNNVTQIEYVNHKESPRYLAIFDFALMSYPEMDNFYFSPLKMFEYLAMSIPVISTDIGQIAKILSHNETGILVTPPDCHHFAEEILKLNKDPALCLKIKRNSRKLAEEELSWLSNARRVLELINTK